jgi:Ca2+-binding RTX toxin-like protein
LVNARLSYILPDNVDNLRLDGRAPINGTGNALPNFITGNGAANTLMGGAGNDTLDAGAGADILEGGTGDDVYFVDTWGDQVREYAGEGTDWVYASTDYTLGSNVENLMLQGIASVKGSGNELNNCIVGNNGHNALSGADGNDSLSGQYGDDTLSGGTGNDTLEGGAGNDTYLFGRGSGQDVVYDFDPSSTSQIVGYTRSFVNRRPIYASVPEFTDTARWDSAVRSDQLWFARSGSDLQVSIIGTADRVTLAGWYNGIYSQIDRFQAGDGKVMLRTQVDALVNAMAAFAPPAAGQTNLPSSYQTALAPTLAANWT